MCGLVGIWDTKQRENADNLRAQVVRMRDTLVHRGPDGAGVWVDAVAGVALGHRRLAIVDLSEHGQQPMTSIDRRYVMVFNGEIYNHRELRSALDAEWGGFNWRGHSDTEVVLAAFVAWGIEASVKRFVGMFAIAVWDMQLRQFYLLRDRLGEKPLYYGWCNGYFLFGSELKSLVAHHAMQKQIDVNSLNLFMQHNCIPAPHTIYRDIRKLLPGHMLIATADQQETLICYWQLERDAHGSNTSLSAQQAVDELQQRLSAAVRLQMVADVPLGAFLSGGIDSSLIVALMQEASAQPIRTFTIGFAEQSYNEAEHALAIARHLGTQHTELYLTAEQTQAVIPGLAGFYDEPFADSSQLPTYILSKLTREHVTVSLSGDGGDELFAGYNRYKLAPRMWRYLEHAPLSLRKLVGKCLTGVSPDAWNQVAGVMPWLRGYGNVGDKLHKLAGLMTVNSPYGLYEHLTAHWGLHEQVVMAGVREQHSLGAEFMRDNFVRDMMWHDLHNYLPNDILVKVDRAGMAVSLETRVPLLDHRVVEFAWGLPLTYKLRHGTSKWVMRELLHRYVPKRLFERPKMGFGVPLDTWLRGSLREWAADLLAPDMLAKHALLDAKVIGNKWQQHQSGSNNWQYHLWDVLMFQAWYEENYG